MAVNDSRSMISELHLGAVDRTFIQLTPNRGVVENPPVARMSWPTYAQCERHVDPPFIEAHARRSILPKERRSGDQDFGDLRY